MNPKILHKDVQQFIEENLKSNITKLILKGSPFDGISIQELANQIIAKQKSKTKLPTWFSTKNIYYPPKVSIEQTSSEITAEYKSKLISGDTIVDITGGFGIDCYYFSKQFKQVIHCEINDDLSTVVKHNYEQLNVKNCTTIIDDGLEFLKKTNKTYDYIYVDPSRRNDVKGKVFLLEDCLPEVPSNIDFFFTKTKHVLLKVSPILDISNTIKDLKNVKEVHVVAVNNEVKELLFLLEKEYTETTTCIKTINILKNNTQKFEFNFSDMEESNYSETLTYLYEPNSAILKSGGFHQISNQLKVNKLHKNSHLYTSENLITFPGRIFKIEHIIPYDKKKLKKILPHNKANVTSRNFPKTVAQFRKETKIKDGGNIYIFLTTDINNTLKLVICKKVSTNLLD